MYIVYWWSLVRTILSSLTCIEDLGIFMHTRLPIYFIAITLFLSDIYWSWITQIKFWNTSCVKDCHSFLLIRRHHCRLEFEFHYWHCVTNNFPTKSISLSQYLSTPHVSKSFSCKLCLCIIVYFPSKFCDVPSERIDGTNLILYDG